MWPFNWLLDTTPFTPRANCVSCTGGLESGVAVAASGLVFLAYVVIPLLLAGFIYRRRQAPCYNVFWLLIVFLTSCGVTQVLDGCMYVWPAYRLLLVSQMLTAAVAVYTLIRLARALSVLMTTRTPAEFKVLSDRQEEVEIELRCTNFRLAHQLTLRNRLEKEVTFLRDLELAKAGKDSGVHRAIDRLDAITKTLEHMMRVDHRDDTAAGAAPA